MPCSVEFSMSKLFIFFSGGAPTGVLCLGPFLEVLNFEFQCFMVLSQEVYFNAVIP